MGSAIELAGTDVEKESGGMAAHMAAGEEGGVLRFE